MGGRVAVVMPSEGFDLFKDIDSGEVGMKLFDEVGIDHEIKRIAGEPAKIMKDIVGV